ncbi:hypothetical protein AAG570_002644 [Ranatra chinensis]|uniref:UBX domain-containing protein n=1 Tax=Ranatra chinensis TaxID=642074 RepID=A0ABD0YQW6_9HEMI
MLERHDWDLEVAVQEQLNMNEGRPSVYALTDQSATSPPPTVVVSDSLVQHVFFSPPSAWGGKFGYLVSFVFQFCYNTFTSVLKFAYSLIWNDTRRKVTDPVGDVLRFVQHFNVTYGTEHPVMYQGSYGQALNDSKRELRFLLIYLHKDANQDADNFCRECLTNREVINYINCHMLFWACNVSSEEGARVSSTLRASTFPFMAVIVLRESRMTLVGRLEGPVNSAELLTRLRAVVIANEACLDTARSERIERNLTQTIRREQDAAYLESLRADQEKERRRCEEEEKRKREETLQRELMLQEQLKKEAIQKAKIDLASDIPVEPEQTDPEALRIVFKMPSGERIERRFLKSNTLKDVFNFVFCHPSSPDSFEIVTNFPKRVLQCSSEAGRTLTDAGLGRSEVLFVYDLDA